MRELSDQVAEHIPPQHTTQLLHNLARHAKEVMVISWSDDDEGIGHINVRRTRAAGRDVFALLWVASLRPTQSSIFWLSKRCNSVLC